MKRVVAYARYSSDSQTEQSIEGQLRAIHEYAQRNDCVIVDEYVDKAMTGTNDRRPAFQKMLADARKGLFEAILVYRLDRFSRSKYENAIHKKTLKDHNVKLVSVMENIPDTIEGQMMESMLEAMAQYYSEELALKVQRGLKESYMKGQYTGGPVLYGYVVENKKNVICEQEAMVVRDVFEMYTKGYTAEVIRKVLRDRNIRDQRGNFFTQKALYKMLLNTKYNGRVTHRGVEYTNIYPKIIDDVLWSQVDDIHQSNKHGPSKKKDIYDYILSGKLVCGNCNELMVGISGTSSTGSIYYYYACYSRKRKLHDCTTKTISKQLLEDLVVDTTWSMLQDQGAVEMLADKTQKLHEQQSRDNLCLKSLEARRNEALKASRNIIKAIEQGIITEQTKVRLAELEREISQLDHDIEKEKLKSYSNISKEQIIAFLSQSIHGDNQSIDTRKALVKTFVKQVIYYPDKIVIVYNFTNKQSRALLTKDQLKTIEGDVLSPSSTFQSLSTVTSLPPTAGDTVLVAKESSSHKVSCFSFSPVGVPA